MRFDPTMPPNPERPWQSKLALRRTIHHPSIPHRWTSRCPHDACGDAPWCAECMTHRLSYDQEAHDEDTTDLSHPLDEPKP